MAGMNKTDRDWEFYGRTDPYYGVLTFEEYQRENLDDAAIYKFFQLGQQHMDRVFEMVRGNFNPSFRPARALDFGCGVGRIVVPLAQMSDFVVGVDVSTSMLDEARANCLRRSIANVDLIQSDDDLSKVSGKFDFIHSYIVFQHIPPGRGEKILQRLLDLLDEEGVGVLHLTYLRRFHNHDKVSRLIDWARRSSRLFNGVLNLARKRPFHYPRMELNEYDLSKVLHILEENKCHNVRLNFSKHSSPVTSAYGVMLFFQKRAQGYW